MNLSMPWICVGKKVCMEVIEMAKQQLETYIVCAFCIAQSLRLLSFTLYHRTKMDPVKNCIHLACTEIRAENLSGECAWLREMK